MTFTYDSKIIGDYYVEIRQEKFNDVYEVVATKYDRYIYSHNYYTDYKKAKRQFNALCRRYTKEV